MFAVFVPQGVISRGFSLEKPVSATLRPNCFPVQPNDLKTDLLSTVREKGPMCRSEVRARYINEIPSEG